MKRVQVNIYYIFVELIYVFRQSNSVKYRESRVVQSPVSTNPGLTFNKTLDVVV